MNKRNAIKELKRLQKVDSEQRMKIAQLKEELGTTQGELGTTQGELGTTQEELNNTQEELNNTQEKLNNTQEELNNTQEKLNNTQEKLNNSQEKLEDVEKVQEQQGLDLAALAKAINSLNDTKIKFEDEYADWEDKYNQLAKFAEENPRLKEGINLEVMKRGMENAIKSTNFIDEKLNKIYDLAVEIQNFEEYNYQNI